MADNDGRMLSRIDANVIDLMKWRDKHEEHDTERFDKNENANNERFERTFTYMKERFDKIEKKMDTVWDERNVQKGGFKATRFAGMGIWAVIVLIANYFIGNASHK